MGGGRGSPGPSNICIGWALLFVNYPSFAHTLSFPDLPPPSNVETWSTPIFFPATVRKLPHIVYTDSRMKQCTRTLSLIEVTVTAKLGSDWSTRNGLILNRLVSSSVGAQLVKRSSTWATCEMYAVTDVQSPLSTIWSHLHDHGQRWLCTSCNLCTRILRRWTLHSCRLCCCRSIGRCLGRTWWTSFCLVHQVHHRHYLSSQTPTVRSFVTRRIRRTCCILSSTSCRYVAAGQISACKDRWVSVDWVCRCQSSACLSSRWTRLQTPPTNDWRSWIRRRFAEQALECSWLHNRQSNIS